MPRAKRRSSAVTSSTINAPTRSSARRSSVTARSVKMSGVAISQKRQSLDSGIIAHSIRSASSENSTSTIKSVSTTKSIVRRSFDSGVSSPGQDVAEKLEPWELKPKTDYTYARSPTYSPRFIGQSWVMPNMSRPRLRGGAPIEISPMSSVSALHNSGNSELFSVSQLDNRVSHRSDQHALVDSDRWAATQSELQSASSVSHMSDSHTHGMGLHESYITQEHAGPSRRWTNVMHSRDDYTGEDLRNRKLPDSVTRSGRSVQSNQSSSGYVKNMKDLGSTETEVMDLTTEEYRRFEQMEKQREYAGRSGMVKESSRITLFGLDEDQNDDSSEPEIVADGEPFQESHNTTFIEHCRVTMLTIITSVLSVLMWPLKWLTTGNETAASQTATSSSEASVTFSASNVEGTLESHDEVDSMLSKTSMATFSDDEDLTHTSTENRTDEADSSIWSSICFYVIFLVYLMCVEVPIGIVKTVKRFVSWLYTSTVNLLGGSGTSNVSETVEQEAGEESAILLNSDTVSEERNKNRTSSRKRVLSTVKSSSVTQQQSTNTSSLSQSDQSEESSESSEDSVWATICYYILSTVVVVFVDLPLGVAKYVQTFGSAVLRRGIELFGLFNSQQVSSESSHQSTSNETITLSSSSSSSTSSSTVNVQQEQTSVFETMFGFHCFAGRLTSAFGMVTTILMALFLIPWTAAQSGGVVAYRWFSRFGAWLHGLLAHLILLDVWLLSRVREVCASPCCCYLLPFLLFLLLLPLVLIPGSRYLIAPIVREAKTTDSVGAGINQNTVLSGSGGAAATISAEALRQAIEAELSLAKADLKSHDSALYKENLAYIQGLETRLTALQEDIAKLETSHALVLGQLKDCCKNETALVGLVKNGVQEQLAAIMLGDGPDDAATTQDATRLSDGNSNSNSAFIAWLNTQFARPADFDAKIAELTKKLNEALRVQAEETRSVAAAAAKADQLARDASAEAEKASGQLGTLNAMQSEQNAAWNRDTNNFNEVIAGAVTKLEERDDKLAAELNEMSAAVAMATSTANSAAKAAAAAAQSEEVTEGSENIAAGVGIGAGCGCDKNAFVIPDTYQTVTEDQVKLLIREALGIFGADKTGMVDYALESSGGSIVSTRCSETYHRRTAQLSLFGIPLWYTSNSPRTVIQPEVQPGQCWAFRGSQGYVVIQLAGFVQPTAFSLEHIPKVLSPTGQIDSAPKDFSVWGLSHERDVEGTPLGNYTFLDNGEPLQFFPVMNPNVDNYHVIELKIHSNHGNQEYTCLYRFRVHGVLKRS